MRAGREICALLAIWVAAASLGGCAQQPSSSAQKGESAQEQQTKKEEEKKDDGHYEVGVLISENTGALSQASDALLKSLEEQFGDKITVTVKNAEGDSEKETSIAADYVSQEMDLILAGSTSAVQAAAAATSSIPVVGFAVPDYLCAGVISSNDSPDTNVTGVSDLVPMDEMVSYILSVSSGAYEVGILSSKDPGSVFQAQFLKSLLAEEDVEARIYSVSSAEKLDGTLDRALERSDLLFVPSDDLLATRIQRISEAAIEQQKPVVCADANLCRAGALASLSPSFVAQGSWAGELAGRILRGEADPSSTAIRFPTDEELYRRYNPDTLEAIDWSAPDGASEVVPDTQTQSGAQSATAAASN